jgi:hypothetical protein
MTSPAAKAAALQAYGLSEQLWGRQCKKIDASEFLDTIAASFDECMRNEREACAKIADAFAKVAEMRSLVHTTGTARDAALDKMEAALEIASKIRERNT